MTETEEEVHEWRRSRCKRPRRQGNEAPSKKAKADKQAIGLAHRAVEEELLFPKAALDAQHVQDKVQLLEAKVKSLEDKLRRQMLEMDSVVRLNRQLQEAMLIKIFRAEVVPVAEEANFDVLRDSQGNEALLVDTAPAPAIASIHRPSETSMVPEQAVALGTPAHVDAATNIVSCHLPVETSLVMNEAMAWDTPAHVATATPMASCGISAASDLQVNPAMVVGTPADAPQLGRAAQKSLLHVFLIVRFHFICIG
ncbi:uncharacterized protein LOC144105026 [Amblyomma americanum]